MTMEEQEQIEIARVNAPRPTSGRPSHDRSARHDAQTARVADGDALARSPCTGLPARVARAASSESMPSTKTTFSGSSISAGPASLKECASRIVQTCIRRSRMRASSMPSEWIRSSSIHRRAIAMLHRWPLQRSQPVSYTCGSVSRPFRSDSKEAQTVKLRHRCGKGHCAQRRKSDSLLYEPK